MHRGVRRNTLQASPPTFRGAISIEVIPVLIEPKEVILVRSRQSKTRSLWMKKPTVRDGLGDLHRLQELPHLLVADHRPIPGCDLRLSHEPAFESEA